MPGHVLNEQSSPGHDSQLFPVHPELHSHVTELSAHAPLLLQVGIPGHVSIGIKGKVK